MIFRRLKNIFVSHPLLCAVEQGDLREVKQLLDSGTNANQPDEETGWTALMGAAGKGHAEVVKVLLNHGADVSQTKKNGWTALMVAAHHGQAEVAKVLLDNGADVSQADEDGRAALMSAAEKGHAEVVEVLSNH